ncbi:hypothetical protein B0H13DRAFT_1886675 [Mycena leptocephala]|nr:hypothetical protein B0H13DRAFT_1886675 [Mycena leptocephala]
MSLTSLCGWVLLLALPANSILTNITIDDTNMMYFSWVEPPISFPAPNPMWAAASASNPCSYCSAQPQSANASAINNQTWHDGRNGSSGSLTFQGSDVFIYGIDLFNSANASFSLDGVATSAHWYSGTSEFVFSALFFAAKNLTAGVNHTVSWVLSETSTNGSSALFDYAVITTDGANSTSSPSVATKGHSKTGPIAGGVVGGVVVVACLAGFLLLRRRRRSNDIISAPPPSGAASAPGMHTIQPFVGNPSEPSSSERQPSKTLDIAWNNSSATSQTPRNALVPGASTEDSLVSSAPRRVWGPPSESVPESLPPPY